MSDIEKILCRNPDPAKAGVNIPLFKYELIRDAITRIVGAAGEEGFLLKELTAAVTADLSDEDKARIGKIGWHMMAVKLEMETAGLIRRVPKASPQRIVLGS